MQTFVELMGGVGNQLFQYAFALWRTGCRPELVTLDLSRYSWDMGRRALICSLMDLDKVSFVDTGYDDFYGKRVDLRAAPDLFEEGISRDDAGSWFTGYFQNTEYVKPVLNYMAAAYENLAEKRERYHASSFWSPDPAVLRCAVHVRRGDYLLPANRGYHGIIKIEAMLNVARSLIEKELAVGSYKKFQMRLFSDDVDLEPSLNLSRVLGSLGFGESEAAVVEFYLMTQADVLVCSNSTFGLWAGLLNRRKEKKVLIPDKWMKNGLIKSENLLCDRTYIYQAEFED